MLTFHQAETAAWVGEGEFICPSCAEANENGDALERARLGLSNGTGLSPISRYELEEYKYSSAYEYALQESEHEEGTDAFEEDVEGFAVVECGSCHKEIN